MDAEREVIEAKRLRRNAHAVFDTQRELVREDLDAAGVGKRIASRLAEEGRHFASEAGEMASNHPTAVRAAALGLTAWFLRRPLLAFVAGAVGLGGGTDDPPEEPPQPEAENRATRDEKRQKR